MKYFRNFGQAPRPRRINEAKCREFEQMGYDIGHKRLEDPAEPGTGYDVYFGMNAVSNDYLTTTYSGRNAVALRGVDPSPSDVWMHAAGIPGSHVVVKTVGDRRIPDAVLAMAAEIAKKNSKGKAMDSISVVFCGKDHVSKPHGLKAGEVLVDQANRQYVNLRPGGYSISNSPL